MLDDSRQPDGGDSVASAECAGLVFVSDCEPGISRRKRSKLFAYTWPNGTTVKDLATRARIQQLAIPPAWTDVWICSNAHGHIQASGRDARGRKQYRYHADWSRVRDESKFDNLLSFGRGLPRLRASIQTHMSKRGIDRTCVLATVAHLLDTTLIRVGNQEYARSNKSFGLTTLQDRHVDCNSSAVRFKFRGKSGKEWRLKVTDRRIARIVKACQDLPGQHLFQYEDADGVVRQVTSADVNAYLREIAGPTVTAKMFRTWAGTVLAGAALREIGPAGSQREAKHNIARAVEAVAVRLGNTASICRKCYIHPTVIEAYLEGNLVRGAAGQRRTKRASTSLSFEEQEIIRLLSLRSQPRSKPSRQRA
jgi:DNA topoisomerase-1